MVIKNVVIAGAGTMGYSIAEILSNYKYKVTLYDINEAVLDKAKTYVSLNRHSLGAETSKMNEIIYSTNRICFKEADMVIETIVENKLIKETFYQEVSLLVKPETILASNTSGLSINELARSVKEPRRFIGMHWFNPSHLVPLVEIVKGEKTTNEVAQDVYDLCLNIGKQPVIVNKDVPGFVANRIQFAILRESLALIEDGVVDAEGIDHIMKYGLGFRYACAGPLEIADFGGLDTFYHISDYLMEDLNGDGGVPPLLEKLYKEGHYGVKTGKGFYDYSEGKDEVAIKARNKKLDAVFASLHEKKEKK